MTILGGVGTLFGPILGVGIIKYLENIFSAVNMQTLLQTFDFLPEFMVSSVAKFASLFVGEGWHLTLGLLFMVIVIFLPGGLMEGFSIIRAKLVKLFGSSK